MKQLFVLPLTIIMINSAVAFELITEKNWEHHPQIKNIRQLCSKVDQAIKRHELKDEEKKCKFHDGAVELDGHLFRYNRSTIRKYTKDGGTGDSISHVEYFYDEKGAPRFTYRTRGAANGTKIQERFYFNENGELIWKNRKVVGPGYTESPYDDKLPTPIKDFAELCKE